MRLLSRKRLGRRSFLIGSIAISLVWAIAIPGLAANPGLPGSTFESLDGNLKVDAASGTLDWENVNQVGGNDLASGSGDDSLKGAEQDPVPGIVDGSIPPSKSDLKSFGVFLEPDSPGFLHMFWTRVQDPSGTTNMDFEFNQKRCVTGDTSGCSSNTKTPTRTAGDILITYNLSSGGTSVSLWLHRWVLTGTNVCEDSQEGGSANSGSAIPTDHNGNPIGCWNVGVNLTSSGDATGSINTAAIPANETDNLSTTGFDPRTFGEASVDLSSIFGDTCFALGGVYLKSRSSDTFTSALKDFIAPRPVNISNCGSLKIIKKDDAGSFLGGAKFKLYRDDGDGVAELGGADVQIKADGTVGAFECETSETDGTGNCSWSNLTLAHYWVQETFLPSGYTLVGANPRLVNVNSTVQVTVNITNNRVPATLKVKKVDDLGNPLKDAVFTLFNDVGSTNATTGPPDGGGPHQDSHGAEDTQTAFSCTTLVDGTCTITGILPGGNFWVVETTTPPGHTTAADQWVQLSLGDNKDITATPFVNPRQHKIIVLVCHEATNTLASSDVTIDGVTHASLANGASGLPATEAQLCALGGASFGGINGHPTKSASIQVGNHAH